MIRKVLKIILTLVVKACDMIYVFSILADQTQASAGPSFPHMRCFSLCFLPVSCPPQDRGESSWVSAGLGRAPTAPNPPSSHACTVGSGWAAPDILVDVENGYWYMLVAKHPLNGKLKYSRKNKNNHNV